MTSPIDRAAEAPRILGVEMRAIGRRWVLGFGRVLASLTAWDRELGFHAELAGASLGDFASRPDAIAAIERELLAIREAIPAPESKP